MQTRTLLLISTFLATILAVSSKTTINEFNDGLLTLSTASDETNRILSVEMVGKTGGSLGFGVRPDPDSYKADVVIGWCDDHTQKPSCVDFIRTGTGRPHKDTTQNVLSCNCKQNATHTTLKFSRLFNTGDDKDDLPIQRGPMNIIWSVSSNDFVEYHGSNRGSKTIDLRD